MARADYQRQMERHAGQWDVLPRGLVVPSAPHGSDWAPGRCRGVALLAPEVLEGNRWPAVSGALLAELARRCATLAALTVVAPDRGPVPRQIEVRFRTAIPVADPARAPRVADGAEVLYWSATVAADRPELEVAVELARRLASGPVAAVAARARFAVIETPCPAAPVERRMGDYLLSLPRRLALPAYDLDWSTAEVRGRCVEPPGSLLAAAEQALGEAGKIVRGDGVPDGIEESMLLADITYRWLADVDDGPATYVATAGPRRPDEKGRTWMTAGAVLSLAQRPVGEASGSLVFRRVSRSRR